LDKIQKEAVQVAKEIVAKFIETRTVSPNNFAEVFPAVYAVIHNTLRAGAEQDAA
jgi:uncharacterized phage infection (PIP) family protein YhgE